jgi:NADPH:quinone reductase-like Zn-dependent oxidoreductase
MPSNHAAFLSAKSVTPLDVKPATYTPPGENEIVVRNGAVAVNPLDWFKQAAGNIMFSWIKYPFVMGSDLAGEVVEVGKGVTRFKVGDRVVGHAVGMDPKSNKSAEGAFQEYTVIRANMASPIPSSMPYENACVLPLGLSTAACALFQKDFLALPYPTVSAKPNGKTVLVWAGSSSVGSNAIQLAVAAGHDVITTASPKNFNYVRSLGAVEVFDYRSPTVIKDIIEAFRNRQSAGAISIGNGSLKPCIEILAASKGRKFVAQASVDIPAEMPSSTMGWVSTGLSMGWSNMSVAVKSRVKRVDTKFIFGSDLMANEVSRAIYEDYLPAALAQGKYIAAPEPLVVGKGLEYVQEAMDMNKKGVSAKKVVVSL